MTPVINPAYPFRPMGSIDELMALAVAMEHEAAQRYDQLAGAMERQGEAELAAVFRQLAVLEREHESGLGRWAERERRGPVAPAAVAWAMPETFDAEGSVSLTPYQVLGIAVRNEEQAFTFYTYLAASAEDDAVRRRAETLAREELRHISQLRGLRRSAFHRERGQPKGVFRADSLTRLREVAQALETSAAEMDELTAEALAQSGAVTAATILRGVAGSARQRAAALPAQGGEGRPQTAAIAGAQSAGLLQAVALTASGTVQLSLRNAGEILEFYLATADHAGDEDLLRAAQDLAEAAVARLAVIRSLGVR